MSASFFRLAPDAVSAEETLLAFIFRKWRRKKNLAAVFIFTVFKVSHSFDCIRCGAASESNTIVAGYSATRVTEFTLVSTTQSHIDHKTNRAQTNTHPMRKSGGRRDRSIHLARFENSWPSAK